MTLPEPAWSLLPESLAAALDRWTESGEPMARWLGRGLDAEGVPRDWPVETWWPILERLEQTRKAHRGAWPEPLLAVLERFFLATLRFSRPGGTSVFRLDDEADRSAVLRAWSKQVADPTLSAVVDRWYPRRGQAAGIPPLPAFSAKGRVLAALRPDWNAQGDILAIDHRRADDCRISLIGRGQPWLGPKWDSSTADGRTRPRAWQTGAYADFLEWSIGSGAARRDRTVVLLRGRAMALIAEQAGSAVSIRVGIAPGLKTRTIEGGQGVILTPARGPSARVWPIGLPGIPAPSDQFEAVGGSITGKRRFPGRRGWLPLLVSWDTDRNRRPVQWRPLTVTENRKVCRDDQAVAWRVSWGRDDTLVIYRSLGPPSSRCFLGHQTPKGTRFLLAEFDNDGDFRPMVTITA